MNNAICGRPIKMIKKTMSRLVPDCIEGSTGELISTWLAEKAADELDLYEKDGFTIPEEVFNLACHYDAEGNWKEQV